jgi:hypothetical protein
VKKAGKGKGKRFALYYVPDKTNSPLLLQVQHESSWSGHHHQPEFTGQELLTIYLYAVSEEP